MMNGETIIGDDIAYLRNIDGKVRAVNVESGIFGIIEGINDTNDPLQWDVLTHPAELIFSNILVTEDNDVHTGMENRAYVLKLVLIIRENGSKEPLILMEKKSPYHIRTRGSRFV